MPSNDSTLIMNMILSNNEEMFHVGTTKDSDSFDQLWNKFWKDDAVIMRPSGKIMSKDEWKDIVLNCADLTIHFSNILSVDNIHYFANGKAAVANYTSHEKFTFNNAENDDITKVSEFVLCHCEGSILIGVIY